MSELILAIALWCGANTTGRSIECRKEVLECIKHLAPIARNTDKEYACWMNGLESRKDGETK